MDQTHELLTRGVANIIPGYEELKKILNTSQKLNIYLGIDPTATRIHLGHAVPLRKLQQFAEQGHHVTFLIGNFTALIGDTSDKESERPVLTSEQIEENFQTYKKQAEKVLDFSKVHIKYNKEWLEKLTFADILKLMQQFSMNDFSSRELIKKRLDEGKRVRLDEVLYPIMQGYDSYIMDTDLQIGGADQTFNMQAGRTLQKVLREKESFVLSTEYLLGIDGRKMSKSWGNAIWLDDTPVDMFAKIMAVNDTLIQQYYILATKIPLLEVEAIQNELEKSDNPMHIKKHLARQIVSEVYDSQSAEEAQLHFERTVQQKEIPIEMEIIEIKSKNQETYEEFLLSNGFTSSKSEAKRLIEQGGVSINDKKITHPNQNTILQTGDILRIGKRKIVKIKTA